MRNHCCFLSNVLANWFWKKSKWWIGFIFAIVNLMEKNNSFSSYFGVLHWKSCRLPISMWVSLICHHSSSGDEKIWNFRSIYKFHSFSCTLAGFALNKYNLIFTSRFIRCIFRRFILTFFTESKIFWNTSVWRKFRIYPPESHARRVYIFDEQEAPV